MKKMNKVLIIDDSDTDQSIIGATLSGAYELFQCYTLADARIALKNNVDLIVLDVILSDGNGFDFFVELRSLEKHKGVPVIFLTSKNSEADIIKGLSLGAEDFVVKPFSPIELKLRVEKRITKEQLTLEVGDLTLKKNELKVLQLIGEDKKDLNFKRNEFLILFKLLSNTSLIHTRDMLLNDLNEEVFDRSIDTYISRIRKKIQTSKVSINTVYGTGYQATV